MAANPSIIAALASPQTDNPNNESKKLSELAKAKQEKEGKYAFEQFQADLLVQNPRLASVAAEYSQGLELLSSALPQKMAELTLSYLREREILQLGAISPVLFAHSRIYEIMRARKLVSEKLLPHVFGANPERVDAFIRMSGAHPRMLLTESSYDEGYNSSKLGKFVCFRRYKAVSALVGAYRCGDGPFLGRKILAYLLRENNLTRNEKESLLFEAREQLSELLGRIPTPTSTANTTTSATPHVATAGVAAASAATAASTATAVNSNDTASSKEKAGLNSDSSANTDEFEDSLEFLSAIVKLINAYNAYTSQYDSLATAEKWTEIKALWGEVCECQKLVYHYVKLEFFGPTPFSPLPAFDIEPPRGPCRYYNNESLDLDEIGRFVGLYKAAHAAYGAVCRVPGLSAFAMQLDLAAISHLYKLRVDDLRNTIDHLRSLEGALIFLNDVKPALRIDL